MFKETDTALFAFRDLQKGNLGEAYLKIFPKCLAAQTVFKIDSIKFFSAFDFYRMVSGTNFQLKISYVKQCFKS